MTSLQHRTAAGGARSSGGALEVRTTDYHTAGEPFRIVTGGAPELPGSTVADRRQAALQSEEAQRIRAMLCHEPRGHADMYGGFLVPPDDDGAHLGVLFWHKDGFSTACGHGTIALGAWAVESGLVAAAPDGDTDVVVDVPSGRVLARVRCEAGRVVDVTFRNVPSYVVARDVPVATSRGALAVDVVYGGAIYATLTAAQAGLAVTPEHYGDLIALGREIKWALDGEDVARHPDDDRLSGIYGTIWVDELGGTAGQLHQRNVTVFADGEVDRSPCGSGTAARVALLAADGRLPEGTTLRHDSIVGTTFLARVAGRTRVGERDAVIPEVTGMAYRTGEHLFVLDPRDPVGTGFVLR
ncbi:MAG: proline racemase family protein [Actinomycetales bacterium]